MPDERASIDRANRYWNAVVLGTNDAAQDIEPGLAAVIQQLHALAAETPVTARERVWQKVLVDVEAAKQREEEPMLQTITSGPYAFPTPGSESRVPARPGLASRQWAMAQLATAALLALVVIGSFFAFGPGRTGRPAETPAVMPAIVASPATPQAEAQQAAAELLWETKGGPNLPLGLPGYLALDPAGNLWITDSSNDRFQIFSPDGEFLESWGQSGDGEGQFAFERDLYAGGAIAFAPDGGFYVVDTGNLRIQRFAPDGTFITAWGGEGAGNGQFTWPSSVAVDSQGQVYVTDDRRNDVQVFDENGGYLRTIGEYGFGEGQFFFSTGSGIVIDAAGDIWISDGSNHRIQTFSADGEFLSMLRGGPGKDQLSRPAQAAIDDEGRIFVAAPDLREVQVFTLDGRHLASWGDAGAAAWAEPSLPPGTFLTPIGLVLDGMGNIYVSDTEGERVQKFRLLPPLAPASTAAPAEE